MKSRQTIVPRIARGLLAGMFVLLVCGCTGPGPDDPAPADPADAAGELRSDERADDALDGHSGEQPTGQPQPPGDATVGGDGSAIALAPLTAADIEGAALAGELACRFSLDGGASLLFAMGDVASQAPSHGVVKVGNHVEPVAARGGFDAMLEGTTFTGAGKTVRIALTGPAIGGGESPPRPATLTYDRADGARRDFAGQWQCGP